MRISVLSFFIGAVHALSKNTHSSELSCREVDSISNDFNSFHNDPVDLHDITKRDFKPVVADEELFELMENFEARVQHKQSFDTKADEAIVSSSNLGGKIDPSAAPSTAPPTAAKNATITSDEEFVLQVMASQLKKNVTQQRCETKLEGICTLIPAYPGIPAGVKTLMTEKCKNKTSACHEALQKLVVLCNLVQERQKAINSFNKSTCDLQIKKCTDLKDSCNTTLDASCTKVSQECKQYNGNSGNKTASTHVTTAGKTDHVDFVNTHTSVVHEVTYVTETVYYTTTEVVLKTRKCCAKKTVYTVCPTSEPTYCPVPTVEPEPTETSAEESTETSTEESTLPESTEESEPTTTEEPAPEPTEEPSESHSDSTEECSITVTVTSEKGTETVTLTVSNGSEAHDKGHGVRIKGYERIGLICLIIGITAGIWIVV